MTNPHLNQAREWAEYATRMGTSRKDARAAIDLIQSLPDQWVDVEKVREVINSQLSNYQQGTVGHSVAEDFACKLQFLLAPPLPTLAELIQAGNDPQQYQWMQAELDGDPEMRVVIASILPVGVHVLFKDGWISFRTGSTITPLPDLPRLEWPGDGVVDAEIVEDDEPIMMPRPEDVHAGEPWKVLHDGHEWVGTRDSRDDTNYPWTLSRIDGIKFTSSKDIDVTLVSRLVPEVAP